MLYTTRDIARRLAWQGWLLIVPALAALTLAACAEETRPEEGIEAYLEALVGDDDDAYFATICSAWEVDAQLERDAYWAVEAELHDVACRKTGEDGEYTLVACDGAIVLEYDGETRERPLDSFTYLAVEDDGEWKMCGYR